MQLLEVFICPSAVPINAFLCLSRHFFVGPRCHFSVRVWNLATFRLLTRKFVIQTSLCTLQRDHCPANIHVECIPSTLDQQTSWVSPDQLGSSILPTWAPISVPSLPFRCRPSIQIKTDLACGERTDIPRLVLSTPSFL